MGARLGANRYLSLLLAPLCCVAVLVAGVSPAAAAEPSGWSWGSNLWGSLGDPSVPGQYVEMPTQVGSDTWKAIAAAQDHTFQQGYSFAVRADGTLWAWGSNFPGQFGPDAGVTVSTPVQFGSDSDWARIATEDGGLGSHTLATKTDGTLWAWGNNGYGQLGIGTAAPTITSVPQQIGTDSGWRDISVGLFESAAIKSDGTLWMWGNNSAGQLGDGTTTPEYSPEQIGVGATWTAVSVGAVNTYAIRSDGTLWAWGDNHYGQIGDGTTTSRLLPVQVGSATNWVKVGAPNSDQSYGLPFAVGIRTDGTLWAWGQNNVGQLGDGTRTAQSVPEQIGSSSSWSNLAVSDQYAVATQTDGSLWAWGDAPTLRNGGGGLSPVRLDSSVGYTDLAAAPMHALALKSDGTLWIWGYNGFPGSITSTTPIGTAPLLLPQYRSTPGPIPPGGWAQLSTESRHVLAISTAGSLWAWGENNSGELGDATETTRTAPVLISADTDWRKVVAGTGISFGIRTDGTLWEWGNLNLDRTGLAFGNTCASFLAPCQVGTANNWTSVAVGTDHTLGVRSDGTLWAWGDNAKGQLGISGTFGTLVPVQVGTDSNWSAVTASDNFSLAIKTDGSLWSWGDNSKGQLGSGVFGGTVTAPQRVGSTTWAMVSANSNHVVGVRTDGTLWVWGDDTNSVLGFAAGGNAVAGPTQIGTDGDWSTVAAGPTHTVALKSDGSLWAWGDNTTGALGDGTTTNSLVPERIGSSSTWSQIAAGAGFSVALSGTVTAAAPDTPTTPTATVGDRSADVSWPPVSGNGSPIDSYTVTASPGGATSTVSASQLHAKVSNLAPGTTYTFTVHATNAVGDSGESPASNAVTGIGRPDAPIGVTAVAGEREATVSWAAPADNNSPILDYTVTDVAGGSSLTVPASASTVTVTGLISGTTHTFTVAATNAAGTGPSSEPTDPVTPTGAAEPQSISWLSGPPPGLVTLGQSFPVAAQASSGLPVTITVSGPCSYTKGVLTASQTGVCEVTVDQAGNGDWLPAQLSASVTVALVSVASSANPGVPGQMLVLTATAGSSTSPQSSLTGTMRFYDAGQLLGSALVTAGVAKIATRRLGVGSHAIVASFMRTLSRVATVSPATIVDIVPATTMLVLTSNVNSVPASRILRFRAVIGRVAPAVGRARFGTVSFYDGASLLASVPVTSRGTALFATTLTVGDHSITAVYSGGGSDQPTSTATPLIQHVR
jgi:alpha-tubulin suppressor-like RCC1 family protein